MNNDFASRRVCLQALGSLGALNIATPFSALAGMASNPGDRKPTRHAIGFGQSVGANLPYIDSNGPSDIDADNNLWFIQAVGGTIASTPWRIHKGSSMDDLVFQYEFVPDKSWFRPHGDDTWWAEGLWIDPADGTWYVIMHQEYNYNRYQKKPKKGYSIDRFVTVSLARSKDQGRTFECDGEIIGSDHPDDPAYWASMDFRDGGQGDPSLYVDKEYFYIYYNHRWLNRSDVDDYYSGVRVARCRIADKLKRGAWTKFYLGAWSEPGTDGHDSDVFNENYSDTAVVVYSKLHRLYFCVVMADLYYDRNTKRYKYAGYVSTCTDLAKQDWTRSIYTCDGTKKGYYLWMMDPITRSRYVIEGKDLRWYGIEFVSAGNEQLDTWQAVAAHFMPAPATPVTAEPRYPPVSVDDFTPGWDRKRFPVKGK